MDPRVSPYYPEYVPARRPFAWVTWTIVATAIAVFLLQLFELHRYRSDVIGDTLAFSAQSLGEHRYWTILTYAWAHAVAMFGDSGYFWLHIVANMIPLICLGPALEEMMGHWRYLGLYLGGAIASVIVWFYFNSHSSEAIIGASGAVFAVIAGLGAAAPREQVTLLLFYILPLRMSMSALALVACGVEAVQIIFHWMPEIAHSAHLGGAAFGAFYTWLVLPRHRY